MGYIGFFLTERSRKILKDRFKPKYSKFIGEHITYKFGVSSNTKLPSIPKKVEVVGYSEDPNGLECFVVEINGSIFRNDRKVYHITWSLEPNKFKPVHSNNVIENKGFIRFDKPIKIDVVPEWRK